MDVEIFEVEAKATAAKHVSNMLQRPDQLEKVDQYKRRVVRKKASVEAMLKTAMQSQLDGVRSGLGQLETAWRDINMLKSSLKEIHEQFEMVPKLQAQLGDVRQESMRHSQYAAAMENLKHIFTVPESVERTRNWIKESKFLYAHQSLTDLENSRDDLLFELHRLPNQSSSDKNMLKQYFADVEKLSDSLGQQLWNILKRTLEAVKEEPTAVVTAIRIIEREEKADKLCEDRFKQTGYMPSGRPKRWRHKAMNVLETVIQMRIETANLKERCDDKMWLVLHLETLRLLITNDLKIVKKMCVPCFPPHYDIFNKFVQMYHKTLSKRLLDLTQRLEENEYASMLSWINSYEGMELMGNPDLNIDVSMLSPLLNSETVDRMVDKYCLNIKNKFQSWMENTIRTDFQDWSRNIPPEVTSDGHYHTTVPVILFQMIDQYLQLVRTVSNDLVNRVMNLSMQEVQVFCSVYREHIVKYKSEHFRDRSQLQYFTYYMIAIVNNCMQFVELAQQLRNRYYRPPDPTTILSNNSTEADKHSLNVIKTFINLRDESIGFLLDELFLDLESHLLVLFTKLWLTSPEPVDTICVTLEDYFNDYTHLIQKNFNVALKQVQDRIAIYYIKAMLQRKMNLRNYEERKEFAEKVVRESEQMKALFKKLSQISSPLESPFEALPMMVEVVKLKDSNMVSLEILGLKKRFCDITEDQLTALLGLRGDISLKDSRQLVIDIIPKEPNERRSSNPERTSIFTHLKLS